jgi:hypothetical protein
MKYQQDATYAYSTAVHAVTNYTPFHVLRGRPHTLEGIPDNETVESRLGKHFFSKKFRQHHPNSRNTEKQEAPCSEEERNCCSSVIAVVIEQQGDCFHLLLSNFACLWCCYG